MNEIADKIQVTLTREEVLTLIRHWATEERDDRFFYFCYGDYHALCGGQYAEGRIARLEKALDDAAAVKQVIDEIYAAKADTWGWRVFMGMATPEEVAEYDQKIDEANRTHPSAGLVRSDGTVTP